MQFKSACLAKLKIMVIFKSLFVSNIFGRVTFSYSLSKSSYLSLK